MKLGYACINETLGKSGRFKTMTVKGSLNLSDVERRNKIKNITLQNLSTTYNILKWNIKHNIFVYRVTSKLIPLDTHEINNFDFMNDRDVLTYCNSIKELVTNHNIRLSMHPDQFCVLSSHNPEVVKNSIKILEHHDKLCNLIGADTIILHVGSTNGGKIMAMDRFCDTFDTLSDSIKSKIVLENDDKSYTVLDTLDICNRLDIPICIDVHHHNCNNDDIDLLEFIRTYKDDILSNWDKRNTIPKIHLSTGREHKTDRPHADYISYEDFEYCLKIDSIMKVDAMFECKKKDLSVLDVMNKYSL